MKNDGEDNLIKEAIEIVYTPKFLTGIVKYFQENLFSDEKMSVYARDLNEQQLEFVKNLNNILGKIISVLQNSYESKLKGVDFRPKSFELNILPYDELTLSDKYKLRINNSEKSIEVITKDTIINFSKKNMAVLSAHHIERTEIINYGIVLDKKNNDLKAQPIPNLRNSSMSDLKKLNTICKEI